jgi:Uma2 family endonuclease
MIAEETCLLAAPPAWKEDEIISVTAPSPYAVLRDIDWRTYTRLLRVFEGRRFRLTYDRGTLEMMSPLWEHEGPAYLLGRMIDVLTEELQVPCRAGRSITLRRRRKQRGLEPDNCYWIANAAAMQGKRQLDLRIDPPPDLAIEIDVTNSSLDRMSIYASLGVPEVWRLDAAGLAFHILDGGSYQTRANSLSFPQLTAADLTTFLGRFGQTDDTTLLLQFRSWVRQRWPGLAPAP